MTKDLEPLLKRLAELQPSLCKQIHGTWYQVQINDSPLSIELSAEDDRLHQQGLAYLLRAIVLALPPEVLLEIRHSRGQWMVKLLDTELPARFSESDEDMAIALAAAFIDWLEFGHEDGAAAASAADEGDAA
ncbi:hypothetical protein IFO70_10165 [Phormidium tenue FACHB-886]|nr:hypothetical protein [Phormidium tenue FACHB-886]